jgi:hypothetical protein
VSFRSNNVLNSKSASSKMRRRCTSATTPPPFVLRSLPTLRRSRERDLITSKKVAKSDRSSKTKDKRSRASRSRNLLLSKTSELKESIKLNSPRRKSYERETTIQSKSETLFLTKYAV